MAHLDQISEQGYWAGKTVLVTGAAGSIGSGIVRELLKLNTASIVCLDCAETPLVELQDYLDHHNSRSHTILLGSILDVAKMRQTFASHRPHIVIHCAALKHVPFMEQFPEEALDCNFRGTRLLADLAESSKAEKFVLISTDKAVEPANVMGFSKRLAELEMKSRQLSGSQTQFISVRFGNVIGSNGSFSKSLESRLQPGIDVDITHPDVSRYLMSAKEASRLALYVTSIGNGGEIFVYDMGKPVKMVDLLDEMCVMKAIPRETVRVSYTGLRRGEKLKEKLFFEYELPCRKKEGRVFVIAPFPFLKEETAPLITYVQNNLAGRLSSESIHRLMAELKQFECHQEATHEVSPE